MRNEIFSASQSVSQFVLEKFGDARIPFTAGFELTAKCNFSCVHCYAEPNRRKRELTNHEIKKILDILVDHGTMEIFFTGGDCLIRKDFRDLYIYARKKGLVVSILTNATMLTEELAQTFVEYPLNEISITMYGYTKETYESITRVAGSFEQFHRAVDLIVDYGLQCQFKVVGMTKNIHECQQMIEFGRSKGFSVLYAFDMRPQVNLDDGPISLRVTPEEASWFDEHDPEKIPFLQDLARRMDREPDEVDIRRKEGYLYPCMIAKQFVFINCEGKMQGCVKHSELQYDLLNGDFDEGWELLGTLRDAKASAHFPCKTCSDFDFCEQCTASNLLEHGDPELPVDFYCQYAKRRGELVRQIKSTET